MSHPPIPRSALFAHPANFFALGAGLGLSPKAPGTVGTLLGIPLLFLVPSQPIVYLVVVVCLLVFGIWCCDLSTKNLGVHDHPGIVWDEVVGFLVTMFALPVNVFWIVLGFVFFRFFDIIKPWPIAWVDKRVDGGLGIMLDDILAGIFACISLHVILFFIS